MAEKPVVWMGSSLKDMKAFPPDARRKAGHELYLVQMGLSPSDWKPMSSVGPGVTEIRIHSQVEHRVSYVAKFAEAVYVLHAFRKTSRGAPKPDIEVGRKRFQDLIRLRAQRKGGTRET